MQLKTLEKIVCCILTSRSINIYILHKVKMKLSFRFCFLFFQHFQKNVIRLAMLRHFFIYLSYGLIVFKGNISILKMKCVNQVIKN